MSTTQPEFAAIVGIDWADRKHDICLQVPGAARQEFLVLEQRPEAIADWANGLRERFSNRPIAVGVELRKGPLINALGQYEHLTLFPIDPAMLARLRRAFKPSGAKDDPSDAALAVDILLHHRDHGPPAKGSIAPATACGEVLPRWLWGSSQGGCPWMIAVRHVGDPSAPGRRLSWRVADDRQCY